MRICILHNLKGTYYALFQSLDVVFGSTRVGFHATFLHYFSHIPHCCSSSLPSLSVTLCLVPVSMKPLLLKSTMCSDWSSASSMFGKCPAAHHNHEFQHNTNSTRPRPFILQNMGNIVTGRKLKTTMEAFQVVQEQWQLFQAQTATLHTKDVTCKKAL